MSKTIETDLIKLRRTPFEPEDVEHVEDALRLLHANQSGLKAMPGLEHVRNMIAARCGLPAKPEGSFNGA